MEKEFEKTYAVVVKNTVFKLHIPENNYGKIRGAFQNIEEQVGAITTNRSLIRKSYFISMELIDNVIHYGFFNGLYANNFILSHADKHFYFASGNLVEHTEIAFINQKLEEINAAFDREDSKAILKKMYKDKLLELGELDKIVKIGIIELARRLDSKILYRFENVNDKYSVFSIICSMDEASN